MGDIRVRIYIYRHSLKNIQQLILFWEGEGGGMNLDHTDLLSGILKANLLKSHISHPCYSHIFISR